MSDSKPHLVKQVNHFSDGSEQVINYRGVIVDGVLTPDNPEEGVAPVEAASEATAPEVAPAEETVETPAEAPAEAAPEAVKPVAQA